jgi:hypothetical protein
MQKKQCATCSELPEAHFYYYAHHNKQLTIQVKRLPKGKHLPGDAEGKLWMWSRAKCKPGIGISKSTKRVLISTAARGLSFGKFLELSLSHLCGRLSGCGLSFQRDFLHFFGYGSVISCYLIVYLLYFWCESREISILCSRTGFSPFIEKNSIPLVSEDIVCTGMNQDFHRPVAYTKIILIGLL